jgi:hypothetical protein
MTAAPPPKDPIEEITVNGVSISSYDGSGQINCYRGRWESNKVFIKVIPKNRVLRHRRTLDGILRIARLTLPEKQTFRYVSANWPDGCTLRGVTRGGDLASFVQGQFLLETPHGNLSCDLFADRDPIEEASIPRFFDDVRVTELGFSFPIDEGSGGRLDSPLYPAPSELP